MSVHGGRAETLTTLESCLRQFDAFKTLQEYRFSVYITLDNCTESMADAISQAYPEVRLVDSPVRLFWTNGISLAWKEAALSECDFYLWIKKGAKLMDHSLAVLLEISYHLRDKAIVTGTVASPDGQILKGGRTRSGKLIQPDPVIPLPCEIFDGDIVLVPHYVYSVLGKMDRKFVHSFGDYDYAVRAQKEEITVAIAPGILALREDDHMFPVWRDGNKSLRERYAAVSGPEGKPFRERFMYDMRRRGVAYAVFNFISENLKILFPQNGSTLFSRLFR